MTESTTVAASHGEAPCTVGKTYHPGWEFPIALVRDRLPLAPQTGHPRFALCLLARGSGLVEIGERHFLATAPTALLLDESLWPAITQAEGMRFDILYFDPAALNCAFDIARLRADGPGFSESERRDFFLLRRFLAAEAAERVITLSPGATRRIEECFAHLAREGEAQSDFNWPCRLRSFLIEALISLQLVAEEGALAVEPAGLDRALLLVHQRFQQAFTVADLARWCHSNRTTVNDHFQRRTGHSVKAYVTRLRMKLAADLLRDTLLPVSEILQRVGYENASHFSRAFREATGMAPSSYRERNNWILPLL